MFTHVYAGYAKGNLLMQAEVSVRADAARPEVMLGDRFKRLAARATNLPQRQRVELERAATARLRPRERAASASDHAPERKRARASKWTRAAVAGKHL